MAVQVAKLIFLLVILVLPFQVLGVIAYYVLRKSDLQHARRACVLLPPAVFFIVFFVMFLFCYFTPDMMFMVGGMINLFVLILMAIGTVLNLAAGAGVRFILDRKNGYRERGRQAGDETVPPSDAQPAK